jgi:segregation and condensation protein B
MRYVTTPTFLEHLGLSSLDDLPPLAALVPSGPLPPEPAPGAYRQARRELGTAPEVDPQ